MYYLEETLSMEEYNFHTEICENCRLPRWWHSKDKDYKCPQLDKPLGSNMWQETSKFVGADFFNDGRHTENLKGLTGYQAIKETHG